MSDREVTLLDAPPSKVWRCWTEPELLKQWFAPLSWEPSVKPFATFGLTFEDVDGGKTRNAARALHWSAEDRKRHEDTGFHKGWARMRTSFRELAPSAKVIGFV